MAADVKQIKMLELEDGSCPFETWYGNLRDLAARARVRARLARFKGGNLGQCKPVGEGVSEAKIDYGPGYRIYFAQKGDAVVVLLVGGDKKSQREDIAKANKWWKDYKDAAERFQRDFRE